VANFSYPPPSNPSPTSPWWYPSTVYPPALYNFPNERFNIFLQQYGMLVFWLRGHLCACIDDDTGFSPEGMAVKVKGTPSPYCNTCGGRGLYWDPPQGPYTVAFQHPPHTQGATMQDIIGIVEEGINEVIVPTNATPMWAEVNTYDAVVVQGSDTRFHSTLTVGVQETLPYFWNVHVNPNGVTVYDSSTQTVVPVPSENITVNNDKVILTGYPKGTPYVVDYTAWPIYVVFGERGGIVQFAALLNNTTYPRTVMVKLLDLWTRQSYGGLGPSSGS
jgi:hypothetical protein